MRDRALVIHHYTGCVQDGRYRIRNGHLRRLYARLDVAALRRPCAQHMLTQIIIKYVFNLLSLDVC